MVTLKCYNVSVSQCFKTHERLRSLVSFQTSSAWLPVCGGIGVGEAVTGSNVYIEPLLVELFILSRYQKPAL